MDNGVLLKEVVMKRPRKPASLSLSVHHRLNMYALAASAAGVSLLALAPPSEAEIVYTKAHVVLGARSDNEFLLSGLCAFLHGGE